MLFSSELEKEMSEALENDAPEGVLNRLSVDFQEARDIEKAIEAIGNAINHQSFQFVAKAIFGQLQRTHRYLQSEIGQVIMSVLKRYAELEENQYDARNGWLVNAARDIDEKTPYLIK